MAKGILGRKLGMTQIFDAAGNLVPVTIVDCSENVVLQQKTVENDGYVAVQVGVSNKKESLSNKPEQGHVTKANTAPKRFIPVDNFFLFCYLFFNHRNFCILIFFHSSSRWNKFTDDYVLF